MKGELLKSRLHLDQVELWREVGDLLSSENQNQIYNRGGDITSEYYVKLLSEILQELGKEVPKDSKGVQTEFSENVPEIWDSLKTLETINRDLENYRYKVSDFRSYVPGSNNLSEVCMEVSEFSSKTILNLLKNLEFCGNKEILRKIVELVERKDTLLKDIIASQHSMLLSLRDIKWSKSPEKIDKYKFKVEEDKNYKLKNELEFIKLENERLRIRVELYKSELARIYDQKESS